MATRSGRFARIGGPALLERSHLILFGLLIIIIASLVFGETPGVAPVDQFLLESLANIGTWLFVIAFAEVAKITIFARRRSRPVAPVFVILFGAATGVLALLCYSWFEQLVGLRPVSINLTSIALSCGLGAIGIVLSSLFEISRREQRSAQRVILETNSALQSQQVFDAEIADFFESLRRKVSETFRQLDADTRPEDALETVMTRCIKPISRGAWAKRSWLRDLIVVRGVSQVALSLRPFSSPLLVGLVYGISIMATNQHQSEDRAASAPMAALIGFVVASLGFAIGKFLSERAKSKEKTVLPIFFLTLMFLSSTVTFFNQLIFWGNLDPIRFLSGVVANLIFFALLALIFSALKLSGTDANEAPVLLTRLRDKSTLSWANREYLRRQLAGHLHSSVQNQILAIQLNEKTTDSLGLSEIEQRVMEVIRDAEQTFRRLSGASLGEALEALRSDWEGYAVIKWEKLPENLSSSQERPIIALVQEAVTNAIRHGFAKMVEIRISQKNQQNVLYLEVLDDGTGPLGKRVRKGLGSRLLDELSNDNWSLEFRKSGGGRLVAEVIC